MPSYIFQYKILTDKAQNLKILVKKHSFRLLNRMAATAIFILTFYSEELNSVGYYQEVINTPSFIFQVAFE